LADQKLLNVELQKLWALDIKIEQEKFINYMNNNHYKSEEVNWDQVFDFVKKEDKNILNDPNIFKKSNLRYHNNNIICLDRQLIINTSTYYIFLQLISFFLLIYSVIRQKMLDKYKYENEIN